MPNKIESSDQDPFTTGDDDPFLTGGNERVDPDDLDDRLLLIFPTSAKTMRGRDGAEYLAAFGDVVVLSGPETDMIKLGVKHMLSRIMFTGARADRLETCLNRGRKPLLAVQGWQPSSYNKKIRAHYFSDPDEAQIAIGRAAYREWEAAQDPFADADAS